jgi:hypothetical protein
LVVLAVDGIDIPVQPQVPRLAAETVAKVELGRERLPVERRVPPVVEVDAVGVLIGKAGVGARRRDPLDGIDVDVVVVDLVDPARPAQPGPLAEQPGQIHDVAGVVGLQAGVQVLGLGPDAAGVDHESGDVAEVEIEAGDLFVDLRPEVGRDRPGLEVVLQSVIEHRGA